MAVDQSELAGLLGKRFLERRDVKAQQRADGSYTPVQQYENGVVIEGSREPFTMNDLRAHLAGERTYGHYLVSPEDRCRVFCFDIDLARSGSIKEETDLPLRSIWRETTGKESYQREWLTIELRGMAAELAQRTQDLLELPVAVAYSGNKGLHVYAYTGPVEAADARAAAVAVLESFGGEFERFKGVNFFRETDENRRNLEIETFPKQGSLNGKDIGNLLRLPLGVNRKSGQPGFFIDMKAPVNRLVAVDPLEVLTNGSAL